MIVIRFLQLIRHPLLHFRGYVCHDIARHMNFHAIYTREFLRLPQMFAKLTESLRIRTNAAAQQIQLRF